jgi:Zn ribbon nucleic-acid-binding protein
MKAPQLICDNCGKNNFVLIWNVNKISIQKCTNCGLVSANVNYKDLENLYEKDYTLMFTLIMRVIGTPIIKRIQFC